MGTVCGGDGESQPELSPRLIQPRRGGISQPKTEVLGSVSKAGTSPAGTAQSVVVEDRGKGRLESAQRRFYEFNLCSERKRVEKLRYIHRDP